MTPGDPRWIHEFQERLLIFSVDAGSKTSEKGRAAAERLVNEMVQVPNSNSPGVQRWDVKKPQRNMGCGEEIHAYGTYGLEKQ